jgi:beta-galactosidase
MAAAKRTSKSPGSKSARRTVTLSRGGLRLAGVPTTLPLRSGAVHYWRLDPSAWRPALTALAAMEVPIVETYIPWGVHEVAEDPVRFSFRGERDVAAFLREAHAIGLRAIVRPGPHVNAELTDFGIPERVLWRADCQARTPRQNPVILPAPPRAFPVPSYASKAFLAETSSWFSAVGEQLRDLVWPKGPIVMAQIDNEGALYFRDGAYDQDYHPDAIALFRAFLRARYKSIGALRRAWGVPLGRFEDAAPPLRYDARSAEDLPRHLDWAECHEAMLAEAFRAMARSLEKSGISGIPFFHNLPMGESATPLHPALLRRTSPQSRAIDLVSLDYYHRAGDHQVIARRSSELAVACDALDQPAFGAEMGAGQPPFFPMMEERDAVFTVLCALAYGVRGYNVYMAVERDRWLGSPIDRDGVLRPFAAFWRKLGAAFDRVRFSELRRDVPARLVIPRSMRRLARVMHAFGPASQALFRVMGAGLRETVLEDGIDFGDGTPEPPPMRAGRVLAAAEDALDQEGIPWALVDGGDADVALRGAKWIVVPTACGLGPDLLDAVLAAKNEGAHVTFAPAPPTRNGSFIPLSPKTIESLTEIDLLLGDDAFDVGALRRHVATMFAGAPRIDVAPEGCAATVHRDESGPRVVFLVNPTRNKQRVIASIEGVRMVRDLLDASTHVLSDGVPLDALSVRFCEVIDA